VETRSALIHPDRLALKRHDLLRIVEDLDRQGHPHAPLMSIQKIDPQSFTGKLSMTMPTPSTVQMSAGHHVLLLMQHD